MARQPLTETEIAGLMRRLSDLESGTPRQWYWLELAAGVAHQSATRREKILGIALGAFGINFYPAIPFIKSIPGIAIYQRSAQALQRFAAERTCDALLFCGCLLALMSGFNLLSASLQLGLWVMALFACGWQTWKQWPQGRNTMAELPEEEELPGSEASLGLQGMLITRGCEANAAQAMVHGLRVHPEQFLAPLLANLPELAPDEPPTLRQRLSLATLPWLAITLIGCELIGRMPSHLGTALVLLLMAATGWKIQRRILLLLLISWSASFALARLAHWL